MFELFTGGGPRSNRSAALLVNRTDMFTSAPALPDHSAAPSPHERRSLRRRRALKRTGIMLAAVVALTLVSATANAAMTHSEKSALAHYGQRVAIDGGSVNVLHVTGSGPTLVLLSGLGTAAPAVDFAPLISELDGFDIFVVEGFGYGFADMNVSDRTVENITAELHQALDAIGVTSPVVLVGHSIAGLYMHYYANEYPGSVAAIVGIDPTASTTAAVPTSTPSFGALAAVARFTGFERWVAAVSPSLSEPDSTAYSADERDRIHAIADWNFANAAVADEWAKVSYNAAKAGSRPFPADVPVLEFLSTESIDGNPAWRETHEQELAGVTTQRIEIVEGRHYLHWSQAPKLADDITTFLATSATR